MLQLSILVIFLIKSGEVNIMGLFDTFKGLVGNLNNEVAKFQNADFLDATVAFSDCRISG